MSNSNAIAAVTATLQAILGTEIAADPDLNDTTVTALPLDKARGTTTTNQLNLFLYQVLPNAAWRNMDMPKSVRPGETGMSPLALDLHYLITAFGRENDTSQPFDHHLLGKAMSVLKDHALLGPEEIQTAFPGSGLESQPDRVRITLQPLSVEDISKLWMGFATQYRVSVGYDVSVTLIDSTQPVKTSLPVLTRGPQDKGPVALASIASPLPTLYSVALLNQQLSARLGDTLTLTGANLDGTNVGVQFNNPAWTAAVEVTPSTGGSSSQLSVQIPNQASAWPAGFYTMAVIVQRPGETYRRTTNQLAFSLAPSVTVTPASASAGSVTYTATCSPQVWVGQIASLLLGNMEIPAQPFTAKTGTLTFVASNLASGGYYFRLRVDGVDSLLVNRAVTPPIFDSTQQVTIT
jgi:Pvc16 N-terminal domain